MYIYIYVYIYKHIYIYIYIYIYRPSVRLVVPVVVVVVLDFLNYSFLKRVSIFNHSCSKTVSISKKSSVYPIIHLHFLLLEHHQKTKDVYFALKASRHTNILYFSIIFLPPGRNQTRRRGRPPSCYISTWWPKSNTKTENISVAAHLQTEK